MITVDFTTSFNLERDENTKFTKEYLAQKINELLADNPIDLIEEEQITHAHDLNEGDTVCFA